MDEENKKRVDESWKDQVEKEKKDAEIKKTPYHQPNFTMFLTSLSMQAMIAMGKLENPVDGKVEQNLEQARFLIDTLEILKNKTKGNLTTDEEKVLDESLFNLRLMYVEGKSNDR
jgi:hypothetical protein